MIRTAFYISDFESIDLTNPNLRHLHSFLTSKQGSIFILTSKDHLDKIKQDLQKKIRSNLQSQTPDYSNYLTEILDFCNYLPYDQVRNQHLKFRRIPSPNDLHQKGIAYWCFTNEDDYFALSQEYNNASYQPCIPLPRKDFIMVSLNAFANAECIHDIYGLSAKYPTESTTEKDSPVMLLIGDLIRSRQPNTGLGIHIHDPYTLENLIKCARSKTKKDLTSWKIYNIVRHMYDQNHRRLVLNVYSRYAEEEDSQGQKRKICNFQEQDKVTLTNLFSQTFQDLKKSIEINIYVVPKIILPEGPRESNNFQRVHRRFILLGNTHIGFDQFPSREEQKLEITCRRAEDKDLKSNTLHYDYALSKGEVITFKIGST